MDATEERLPKAQTGNGMVEHRAAMGAAKADPAVVLDPNKIVGQGERAETGARPDPAQEDDRGRQDSRRLRVADIRAGQCDQNNNPIQKVYASRQNYAIYCSDDEVRVQFSDVDSEKDEQFWAVTEISAPRYELDWLTHSLRKTRSHYLGQIAAALRIAIEKGGPERVENARAILERAIASAKEERGRIGRRLYLLYAVAFAFGAAVVLLSAAAGLALFEPTREFAALPAGAGSGAFGALLSIAIALRGRTVAPDHDIAANQSDAAIRLLVGILSAGALVLFVTGGLLAGITVDGKVIESAAITEVWPAILALGCLAGFSERLVPDLLERTTPTHQSSAEKAGTAPPG